jgi:hypothetical protein
MFRIVSSGKTRQFTSGRGAACPACPDGFCQGVLCGGSWCWAAVFIDALVYDAREFASDNFTRAGIDKKFCLMKKWFRNIGRCGR